MNFCRNCGTSLAGRGAPAPAGTPMPGPGALAPPAGGGVRSAPNQSCPTCGGATPAGFAFCQQCGNRLAPRTPAQHSPDAVAATLAAQGPEAVARAMGGQPAYGGGSYSAPTAAPFAAGPPAAFGAPSPAFAPPAAAPPAAAPPAAFGARPAPAADVDSGPGWGTLVAVKRDGSDGQRFPMRGEWIEVGRSGADVSFPEDPFLARKHARLERAGAGVRVVPIDGLNGVFRRLAAPTPLEDGDIILAGREIMRFELVTAEERGAQPLVRHGVTLFGSPPREPWARLLQLLPSGGVRDVRHLDEEEIVIGREEGDMVFNDDAFLSRRHAALRWKNGRCTLEDLRSSNGTFVRMRGPTELRSGEHVRMGDQLFRIETA